MFGMIQNGIDSQERRKLVDWRTFELAVLRTANSDMDPSAGLVGETGELIDLWKKQFYQHRDIPRQKVIEEAGDVLWYLACLVSDPSRPEYMNRKSGNWWSLYLATFAFLTGGEDASMVLNATLSLVREMTGDQITAEELFSEIALANMAKLAARYPEGFAPGGGVR